MTDDSPARPSLLDIFPPWRSLRAERRSALRSPLSAEACAAQLSARIDPEPGSLDSKPVVGQVDASGGRLHPRQVNRRRKALQAPLTLEFEPGAGGVTIHCRSQLQQGDVNFLAMWLVVVALVVLLALAKGLSPLLRPGGDIDADEAAMLFWPVAMLIGGGLAVHFGAREMERRHRALVDFVRDAVSAEDITERPADHRPATRSIVE